MKNKVTIGLVDDHQLFLRSLKLLIDDLGNYEVVLEAKNGRDLIEKLKDTKPPDILLLDVNMPHLNGFETAKWCAQNIPATRLAALSQNDSDKSIINMLRAGCCAYLLKDTHPDEFQRALEEISTNGFYNSDLTNITFRRAAATSEKAPVSLTQREKEFVTLACSDLTYKEIAARMKVSTRTVDGYREALFEKMAVQSRVGMCLEALRQELITI